MAEALVRLVWVLGRHQRRLLLVGLAITVFSAVAQAEDRPATQGRWEQQESVALPLAADLRPVFDELGLERRTQGKRGTCSVFTVVGALEFVLTEKQKPQRLSIEFLNWAANQVAHNQKDGGFFSDMWKGFEAYGIWDEKEMPYSASFDASNTPTPKVLRVARQRLQAGLDIHWIKLWDVSTGLTESHLLAIRTTLSRGLPVCAGLRWPKAAKWRGGVLQMCGPEDVFDGHSVLLVDYRQDETQPGGGLLIFRNTNNKDRDGHMPYAYACAYMNDAMWIEAGKPSTATRFTRSPGGLK